MINCRKKQKQRWIKIIKISDALLHLYCKKTSNCLTRRLNQINPDYRELRIDTDVRKSRRIFLLEAQRYNKVQKTTADQCQLIKFAWDCFKSWGNILIGRNVCFTHNWHILPRLILRRPSSLFPSRTKIRILLPLAMNAEGERVNQKRYQHNLL